MPDFDAGFAAVGAVGGALPDVLRFIKGRHEGFPEWFKKPGFWVALLALVLLGAAAAWLGEANAWQTALALGYAAPEFFSRLAAGEQVTLRSADVFPIRRWWNQ
jgi:hypothetical protein